MALSIYDLALHTTLKVCELRSREAVLGKRKAHANFTARCIFVRLLAQRGCSDSEIAEYAHRDRQVVCFTRRRANEIYHENHNFVSLYDYANHIMHESISVTSD